MRKRFSRVPYILLSLIPLVVACVPAQAGPCAADIDKVQALVDAKIDAIAGAGQTGVESTYATMNRQPTPASIARAEQLLDEGASTRRALAALALARVADGKGNKSECEAELNDARAALAQ